MILSENAVEISVALRAFLLAAGTTALTLFVLTSFGRLEKWFTAKHQPAAREP